MYVAESRMKWFVLTVCCIVVMVNAGIRMSFGVFFKPLQDVLGTSRYNVSLIQSFFELGFGFFQLVTGRLVDIAGPKKVILAGLAVLAGAFLLVSKVQSVLMLFLVYGVMVAFGAGSTSLVAAIAVARQWFVTKSNLAVSSLTASLSAGQLILIPAVSYFVSAYGPASGFRLLSVLSLTAFIVVAIGLHNKAGSPREKPKNQTSRPPLALREVCQSRSFWVFGLTFAACGFGFSFIVTHFIPFATDLHMHSGQASGAMALIGGVSIAGTLLAGYVSDIYSKRKITALLFFIRALAMAMLFGNISHFTVYTFAVVIGLTWTATVPLISSLSVERFGAENTGSVLGALFLLHQAGAAAGSYLGGLIAEYTHGYHAMFAITAAVDLMAAAVILTHKKVLHRPHFTEATRG